MFNIPGYQLITQGHSCRTHSGLIIFLADSYSYLIKSIHRGSQLWDGLFKEVTPESLSKKIVIGNLYRPPHFDNNNETIKHFCQELVPIISKVSKSSSHVIIAGNFNIDLRHINEWSEFQKYFDLFVTHGFSPKITVPTQCSKSSSSLIEQMFCKLKDPKQHLSSCVKIPACQIIFHTYLFLIS